MNKISAHPDATILPSVELQDYRREETKKLREEKLKELLKKK
jgi:hypothetical protein